MKITVHCINEQNMSYWSVAKNTLREMDFEKDYLPGCVAAEMGDCKELEALKAQAIVARSFAYQYLLKGSAIYDTGKAQAYVASRAVSKTYLLHRQAVEDTDGIIVTYKGKPANTHYSASNGGYVKKSSNKWEPGGYADPWDDGKLSGHGSGMSQNGAENMAKAGKTHQEILAFYYPGTKLKGKYGEGENVTDKKTKMQAVIDFMRKQLGEPYDLGDHGPDKWDCSGLTMEAVELIGLYWSHSSNSQWYENVKTSGDFDAYGTLKTLPANTSVFLFHYGQRTNGETGMVHVAALDGANNGVIQAGGYLGKGVHENPYSDCKPYFSHWATIKVANEPFSGTVTTDVPATLRINSSGELVKTLQILLNENGANLKEDGKFGPLTEAAVMEYQTKMGLTVDSVVGPETWNALLAVEIIPDEEPLYTVTYSETLTNLTYVDAMKVLDDHPNATMKQQ